MRLRTIVGMLVLGLSIESLAACAAEPIPAWKAADRTDRLARDDGDDEDDETTSPPPSPAATQGASPQAGATLSVSFRKGVGNKIQRVCTDNGSRRSRASLYGATGIHLVPVDAPAARVDPVGDTTSIDEVKRGVESTGNVALTIDPTQLGGTPRLYAIIASGNGFGSPEQCGMKVPPPSDGDAEQFPDNCGVVGYLKAHWDASQKAIVATPATQLLWAANPREGSKEDALYGAPMDGKGCDQYDSPLMLDFSASLRGVTLGPAKRDLFDIDGDGRADEIPWPTSSETAFLARDANGNGVVDGIDELFGNRTRTPLAGRAPANGFEALAAWDANGDAVIDARDPVWSSLRLWFDRDHDGRTGEGELVTLASRGLRQLAVSFVAVEEPLLSGGERLGEIRQRSSAFDRDGRVVPVMDVWFRR